MATTGRRSKITGAKVTAAEEAVLESIVAGGRIEEWCVGRTKMAVAYDASRSIIALPSDAFLQALFASGFVRRVYAYNPSGHLSPKADTEQTSFETGNGTPDESADGRPDPSA